MATQIAIHSEMGENLFTKPFPVSDELAAFLGLGAGAQLGQKDVLKGVLLYAKEKKLINKTNIIPDAALSQLLCLKEEDLIKTSF